MESIPGVRFRFRPTVLWELAILADFLWFLKKGEVLNQKSHNLTYNLLFIYIIRFKDISVIFLADWQFLYNFNNFLGITND